MSKYVIGLDFGTLSCRAVLVSVENGEIMAESIDEYEHSVIDYEVKGIRLPENYALQNADDYLSSMEKTIKNVIKDSKVKSENIIGIGSDFTSSTIMPIDEDYNPLHHHKQFEQNKHAYVKLWKHHAAQPQANKVSELARKRNERFLEQYGGIISSEWMLPKVLQILEESKDVYNATHSFIEAGDWVNLQLTGKDVRSLCQAGFKGLYYDEKFPDNEYFEELDPRLKKYVSEKMGNKYMAPGSLVGGLNKKWSKRLGLLEGTAVSVSIIDAHSGMIGAGVVEEKTMFVAIGTSSCHLVLNRERQLIHGTSGYVKDGIIPGYYAYEAGQASVGDSFEWFVKKFKKDSETKSEAHKRLTKLASKLAPGSNGILSLDWLNGARTPYVNYDLSGGFIGINLQTNPEDMYRSLIEATAFGTKQIINLYEKQGIIINKLIVSGGIAYKNELLMQIYADVTGRAIEVATSKQSGALGAAIVATISAGSKNGGYDNFKVAVKKMVKNPSKTYYPNENNRETYDNIYQLYEKFGKLMALDHTDIMNKLLLLRNK